ncbi:MAG: hypothetical protein AB1505_08580 [Candidatus Latescibacterota bacterium]
MKAGRNDPLLWGAEELAQRGYDWALYDHLERHPGASATDPELLAAVEFFTKTDPERLANYLSLLGGREERAWSLEDFRMERARRPRRSAAKDEAETRIDPGAQNTYDLTVEWLGWLRREEGIQYLRGQMAHNGLFDYLAERHAGELQPRQTAPGAARERRRRKGGRAVVPPDHPLCPDRETLQRYLEEQFECATSQVCRAAALYGLIPAWLRFLEARRLLDPERRQRTLHELGALHAWVEEELSPFQDDPALQADLARAWEGTGG